jgi:uncharacterized membrane protein YfcA
LFNNQGLVKNEFRAGLALVRVAESGATAIVYFTLIPSVILGIPIGAYFNRHLNAETFRRICMSFDAWVVGFGLSRVLIDVKLMESPWAYSVMAVTIMVDCYLLYVFVKAQGAAARQSGTRSVPLPSHDSPSPDDRPLWDRRDPFGPLATLLGYVIGFAGIAMLVQFFARNH